MQNPPKKESFLETLKRITGIGKPHHEIHRPNPYSQARKETNFTRPYANAELKLAPKTFSEQWNGTKNLVVFIRDFYPYLSVLSAVMVGYMIAKLFVTGLENIAYWATIVGITLLVFGIASINEKLKKDTAEECFSLKFGQTDVPPTQHKTPPYAKLALFLFISILISSVGGGELSRTLGDKSVQIDSTFNAQRDSIKAIYLPQIADYDSQIVYYKNFDYSTYRKKTSKAWAKKLNDSIAGVRQEKKEALNSLLDNELKALKTEGKSEVLKQGKENLNLAFWAAGIVAIFELLYIVSFWFEFWVYAGQKEETRNFNFLPQTFYEQYFSNVPTLYINTNPQNFAPQNRNIGFGISNHAPRANIYTNLNPKGFCHCCGASLENKRVDALFCSTKCKNHYHNSL